MCSDVPDFSGQPRPLRGEFFSSGPEGGGVLSLILETGLPLEVVLKSGPAKVLLPYVNAYHADRDRGMSRELAGNRNTSDVARQISRTCALVNHQRNHIDDAIETEARRRGLPPPARLFAVTKGLGARICCPIDIR